MWTRRHTPSPSWSTAAGFFIVLAVSGCTHSNHASAPSTTQPPVVASVTTGPPTTGRSNTSPATTAPAGPSGLGYDAAKAQWLGEALVGGGALENIPYQQAIAELQVGETSDPGNRAGYADAIAVLKDLETLPDANVSPAQVGEYDRWTAELDNFFDTPASTRSQSCVENVTAQSRAAALMWSQEPAGTSSGVDLSPLQEALGDLKEAAAGTPCYAAAITDLQGLETATAAEVAATAVFTAPQSEATMLIGGRIDYLNLFFQTNGALSPNWNGVLRAQT